MVGRPVGAIKGIFYFTEAVRPVGGKPAGAVMPFWVTSLMGAGGGTEGFRLLKTKFMAKRFNFRLLQLQPGWFQFAGALSFDGPASGGLATRA